MLNTSLQVRFIGTLLYYSILQIARLCTGHLVGPFAANVFYGLIKTGVSEAKNFYERVRNASACFEWRSLVSSFSCSFEIEF